MGHFSVRVVDGEGEPIDDIVVMIDYGFPLGNDEKRTGSDGWVDDVHSVPVNRRE
jgi:hypothetical protein